MRSKTTAYPAQVSCPDKVVRLGGLEYDFKQALTEQAAIQVGLRVLDLACGTGPLSIWAKQ